MNHTTNMKKPILWLLAVLLALPAVAQQKRVYKEKFEQLGTMLPTPNSYRTASGAPGHEYWQMQADYKMEIVVDDMQQKLSGSERITYYNNSPDVLSYLWVQLDQNMRDEASASYSTVTNNPSDAAYSFFPNVLRDSVSGKEIQRIVSDYDYDGGYYITAVRGQDGKSRPYTINQTMMRVELPEPLQPGQNYSFEIDWWYNINDRMLVGGRSGYEYFPEDDNYLYTIAQFYPRMAVYDDVNGWQNKQFLGRGEFALPFGNYEVEITVPADHIVASTGSLQNTKKVLTATQLNRWNEAKTANKPVLIVTEEEAREKEQSKSKKSKTWVYKADSVRDFAFATSRKFIWDAMGVQIGNKRPMAMSYYPKEGNPLWEEESTWAVAKTLKTYSKYTVDYPYPVAISVHAASIGMEYPMICFNFGRPNPDGTVSDRTKYGMIGVIIHEVGHNFFPMIINSDERQWTWMDEGLNSFVQYLCQKEEYDNFPHRRGPAASIIPYMKGDPQYIRPIMTNSEQILQFGSNAYAKPAVALNILRETIMGPELFDYAFKEYSTRWAFKHPTPSDFFRTMEDASGVDLDWFWRGWFYTTDHVDISLDDVKWYRMAIDNPQIEQKIRKSGKANLGNKDGESFEMPESPETFSFVETPDLFYREFMNKIDDKAVQQEYATKNFYQITLHNKGGLVMPVIIEWTYADGTTEIEKIPAEIWRLNEEEVVKVFAKNKQVVGIVIDPAAETADTDSGNNIYPREGSKSRFDNFKESND